MVGGKYCSTDPGVKFLEVVREGYLLHIDRQGVDARSVDIFQVGNGVIAEAVPDQFPELMSKAPCMAETNTSESFKGMIRLPRVTRFML